MKIGFIGAGKVGFSLGKYFVSNGIFVTGYYSMSPKSAKSAAEFTNSRMYNSLTDILKDSDTLFITVPDDAIGTVWEYMKNLDVKNKKICHCSGSISSAAFFDAENKGAYVYSIHPLCAVSDRYNSWHDLKNAVFTIEGSRQYLTQMQNLFTELGNTVAVIDTADKALYHVGAVMASNLVIALLAMGKDILKQCGFSEETAQKAILPLFKVNTDNIVKYGLTNALTGPIERNDIKTVKRHLENLSKDFNQAQIYRLLSLKLIQIAEQKYPQKNYTQIKEVLKDEKYSNDISATER
ncbi:MAG TPA: DUF2520 domain-containing protein [Candidatus Megamonas gallistercoris]|nr:DUF2520 domain-containing protein [Candidatus Megamonas gallistercoris]